MNKARRKRLEKAIELAGELQEIIDEISQEEREAFDNMPEGLQNGDKWQEIDAAATNLEDALASVEEVVDYLSSVE